MDPIRLVSIKYNDDNVEDIRCYYYTHFAIDNIGGDESSDNKMKTSTR